MPMMNRQRATQPAVAYEFCVRALPASHSSPERLPAAAVAAFQDLHGRMRAVFGAAGSEMLYRRALAREAAAHPVLRAAPASNDPKDLVQALGREIGERAPEVAAALRAVMAEEISLLARFIGEELVEAVLISSGPPPLHPDADRKPDDDE